MKRFSKYMYFKTEILLIPLLHAISHIFEISDDDHPLNIVGGTLDLANAFVSPGVNIRGGGGGLVPSHGVSRRPLGDKEYYN